MIYDMFKKLCKERQITIKDAAKDMGLSRTTVFAWQSHNPNADTIKKIADYFNVTTDYLLTGKENTATESDGKSAEFISLYSRLDESHQQAVLQLIESLLSSQ